jgi:hypothetical protein
MFRRIRRACRATSPPSNVPVAGSIAIWPEQKRKPPATTA